MEYKVLEDLIEKPLSGEWGKGEGDVNVIRTANFTNVGKIDFSEIVGRDISSNKVKDKQLKLNDIIIEKSGGSPSQPVGRVVFFDSDGLYLCNNFTSVLRPIDTLVYPKYLHYILFCNHKFGFVTKFQNKTTGIINLQLAKYIKNTKIALPPLAEQEQIAAILDAADSLRQKGQQLIDHYTALSQSLFLDMFGDPVLNTMNWDAVKLGEICGVGSSKRVFSKDFVDSGVPFYRGTEVGSLGGSKEITPHLFISSQHYEELKESSGIPKVGDLLMPSICHDGRIWRVDNDKPFYFKDGRVLWVKVNNEVLNSEYLRKLMSSLFLANYSEIASGSTFAELKIVALKGLSILKPPIELQNEFAKRVSVVDKQKQQAQASLEKSEALFNSLLQRAFNGELTSNKTKAA